VSEIDVQTATVDMIGRTGAKNLQIGYLDEIKPTAWVAMATFDRGHKTGSGLSLPEALWVLLEGLVDGGVCQHCHKVTTLLAPTEITGHPASVALSAATCVYTYREDVKAIRPGCQP